jgi:hypothetical protein
MGSGDLAPLIDFEDPGMKLEWTQRNKRPRRIRRGRESTGHPQSFGCCVAPVSLGGDSQVKTIASGIRRRCFGRTRAA